MIAAREMTTRLRSLGAALDAIHAPTEKAFLGYGEVLGQAVSTLNEVGRDLDTLSDRMSAGQASGAIGQLDDAVRQVVALAANRDRHDAILDGLSAKAEIVAVQVTALRKTVSEVTVLAMNAKIQASHLPQSDNDFGVFTLEIARLGDLALATVDQTAARLVQLRQVIKAARTEAGEFERRNAEELSTVQTRLQDGLRTMARRRDGAAHSAVEVGRRSSEVARRIAAAIGEMQINDIAAQRIAHVSEALDVIGDLLGPQHGADKSDREWLGKMEESHMQALAGTVLRLQGLQLTRTRDDFCQRVGQLGIHMGTLAQSAREVSALAAEAFSGSHTQGASFVGELEREIASTRDLLREMDASRHAVKGLMETMSADFASMAVDLRNIQSIDADMRVMGLNATLKCGRLGDRGRALGVIAQELRGCSKRTEEQARRLSDALAESMALASSLANSDDTNKEELSAAAGQAMEASLQALQALGSEMDQVLGHLHGGVGGVAGALDAAAQGMDVGHKVGSALDRAIATLDTMANEVDPAQSDPRVVREEVERLLAGQYTMDSERIVHELFADETASGSVAANASPTGVVAADDLEDCFL